MQLVESYESLEFMQRDGVVVSLARDRKTGQLVQIHYYPDEKIPEASQICERLLSLPAGARSKVLNYGEDGGAKYFVTEPLPEGEGLGEWVARQSASRLPDGQAGGGVPRVTQVERAPWESPAAPDPYGGPRTPPAPAAPVPPGPRTAGPGDFTRFFSGQALQTPSAPPAPERPAPPPTVSYQPPPGPPASTVGFTQMYGAQDLKMPEPTVYPGAGPEAESPKTQMGPGVRTFIGVPPEAPPAPPARVNPPRIEPRVAAPGESKPMYPEPPAERMPMPPRVTRYTYTFPAYQPQPSMREPAELFSPPAAPAPSPPSPAPVVREPAAPEIRRTSAPLFSARVAALAGLSLMAAATIVALIVEFSG